MSEKGSETPQPKEFDSRGREVVRDEEGRKITIIPEARVKRRGIGDPGLRKGTKTAHEHI
ncbi:MAG TPA: hypothetical protein VMR77_00275 [Patescibacteria group bacterium]|jgi:hypothetical protein|nr:hypothetical protein [Patescibacteria group bacterium]